jgi:hypothetical protein
MQKIINFIVIIASTLLVLSGCGETTVRKELLTGVSGEAGEVLVVIDKTYWDKTPGDYFKKLLREDTPGLPQNEPLFNVVNIPRKAFSELFRIHRNIIITKIDKSVEKTGVFVEYDKWAKPQIVISIIANSEDEFLKLFNKNESNILSLLLKMERKRLTDNYSKYAEIKLIDKLEKRADIHLTIPKGYTYDLDTNNFIWISHETPEISQGIFVYYYDYVDSAAFTANALINKRNEILKKYVSGEGEGTYMTTELQVFPLFRSYKLEGKYTAELRGLWKVEGDYMGGPFVSISQLDENRNRVVTVEGYVYAPKYNKREYVRQLEAILYTLEFKK